MPPEYDGFVTAPGAGIIANKSQLQYLLGMMRRFSSKTGVLLTWCTVVTCGSEPSGDAQTDRQRLDRMEMLVENSGGPVELRQPRLVEISDLVGLGVEQIESV